MKTQNRKRKYVSGRALLALCLALTIPLAAVLTACGDRSGTPSGESVPGSGSEASGEYSSGESQPNPEEWEEPEIPEEPDVEVTCSEGTDNCWTLDGTTLTFGPVAADTICSLSGTLNGKIVIDAGDDYAFELELTGFSVSCDSDCPVTVLSGDKVTLTAKKDTENTILDKRDAVEESGDDDTIHSAAVWSKVDLVIGGKGALTVKSENNNGIHGKDDLKVKNLTLNVACEDNALKGNDSVEIESGVVTLIARTGDGVKTTNTDVSAKGNQRGTVTLTACALNVYAACDGIDAAYDVVIEEGTALTVRTDKYSDYSEDVTVVSDDVRYIRFTSKNYGFSVLYGSGDDAKWVNASYATAVESFRETYYYYSFPIEEGYESLQIFVYSSDQQQGQADDYLVCTDSLIWNTSYDTFALSQRGSSLSYGWANYSDASDRGGGWDPGGPGGGGGGNTDKSDHSAKGVKAGNALTVNGGTLDVKAYDDALHANADESLENGETPTGDITIKGGSLTLFSGDDAVHADGTLTVEGGTVNVTGCYEGLEAPFVEVKGGNVSVVSRDDGINSTLRTGTGIVISGGTLFIYAGGDGIDANTTTQYQGIVISGGRSVVINTSNDNSSLDTERGYTFTGGTVLALGPSGGGGGGMGPGGGGMGPGGGGGMAGEAVNCQNFSSVGTSANKSLSSGQYLTVTVGGSSVVTLKMPCSLSALVVYLGSSDASFDVGSSAPAETDANGVCWY